MLVLPAYKHHLLLAHLTAFFTNTYEDNFLWNSPSIKALCTDQSQARAGQVPAPWHNLQETFMGVLSEMENSTAVTGTPKVSLSLSV